MMDLAEKKRCSKCGEAKCLSLFRPRDYSRQDGPRRSWCNGCDSTAGSKWYRKNKERVRARCKEWYKSNKERYAAYTKKWRSENIDRARKLGVENRRSRKYGVTKEQYSSMLSASGGLCAICQQPFDGYPHIDHDHSTGKVRELLCKRCNPALGNFRDSIEVLESAIAYLKKHNSVQEAKSS